MNSWDTQIPAKIFSLVHAQNSADFSPGRLIRIWREIDARFDHA